MSALDDFMAAAKANGKMTLDDHLTKQGIQDPQKRKSIRAQATRAMKPDGPYRHLAEQGIIVPTRNARGRKGGWQEGLVEQDNKYPVVLASDAFQPLRELDLDQQPAAVRQQITALRETNLTGKIGTQVAQTVTTLAYEYQLERDAHEHARQLYDQEQRHHEQTRQTLDRVLALLETGEGKLVPIANSNRG